MSSWQGTTLYASVLVVLVQVAITSGSRAEVPQAVLTSCGITVVGSWSDTVSGVMSNSTFGSNDHSENTTTTRVRQFRGIPYAQPPVGALRFASPQLLQCPSAKTFNASSFGNPCIQPGDNAGEIIGNEDCLTINVFVPEALSMDSSAPVLVYIHGGSLITGSGMWEDLRFLAAFASGQDDVVSPETSAIVVTFNYRLGVLGFLAAPSMCDGNSPSEAACGNFGILDQVAALRWVQQHIRCFGGDPSRVNLMGQSSGGTSIFALMGTPSAVGLFRSGVSLSGSPNITLDRTQKLSQDSDILVSLGCADAEEQLACLQALSSTTVQSMMPNSWNTPALFSNMHLSNDSAVGEGYPGLVFVDGGTIPIPVWDSFSRGVHGNVSLMFGNMGQECNCDAPQHPVSSLSQHQWLELLQNKILTTWPDGTADEVFELYRNASQVNPQLAYDSFNADYGMTCATFSILQKVAPVLSRRAPLYVYVHQWGPQNPPTGSTSSNYAYHTWDYVNACHNWDASYTPGPDDLQLSRLQRQQWFSLWVNGTVAEHLQWPAAGAPSPSFYLFSKESRYPFRPAGATVDPYNSPGLCDFIVSAMGMDERYWWCN